MLKQLEVDHLVVRASDRKVSLNRLPVDAWRRWVVAATQVRKTVRYIDHSGQARSTQDMAMRLQRLNLDHVAIGGVLGAKYHYPQLDLTGSLRLDLTVHQPSGADLGFVRRLNPALEVTKDPGDKPHLVVHYLQRPESYFARDAQGMVWADPVECLADLFEARLDAQAEDMLHAMKP